MHTVVRWTHYAVTYVLCTISIKNCWYEVALSVDTRPSIAVVGFMLTSGWTSVGWPHRFMLTSGWTSVGWPHRFMLTSGWFSVVWPHPIVLTSSCYCCLIRQVRYWLLTWGAHWSLYKNTRVARWSLYCIDRVDIRWRYMYMYCSNILLSVFKEYLSRYCRKPGM